MRRRLEIRRRIFGIVPELSPLLVLALLAGQLVSIGHYVLVAHYACLEHGTSHHGHAQHAVLQRLLDAGSVPALRAISAAHGAHDECAFPARRVSGSTAPTAEIGLAFVPGVERVSARLASFDHAHRLAPLANAPKQSPPTRG